MENVVSLGLARLRKEADARRAPSAAPEPCTRPLAFDFSAVTRIVGASSPSLTDGFVLTPQAEAEIRRIFWEHGLRQMPQTWGELVGNFFYCQLLRMWLREFLPSQPGYIEKAAFADHEEAAPGRGVLLRALALGHLDAVWALHKAAKTFESNAKSPRLTRTNRG